MRNQLTHGLAVLLGLSPMFGLLAGCGEKDVPVTTNEEYIIEYMSRDPYAKELFRTAGYFNTTSYTVPFDSAVVTDRLLGLNRQIDVRVSDGPVDHGYLGTVRDAWVTVIDDFRVEVTRAYSADTLVDTVTVGVDRLAFFMQLGDVERAFAGWALWSMYGTGASAVTARSSTGVFFTAPSDTARLTSLSEVTAGSRLLITTSWSGDSLTTCHLLSDYDQAGAFTRPMSWYYDTKNYDSLSYQVPSNHARFYNLFMVQTLRKTTFPSRSAFVVPYKIP